MYAASAPSIMIAEDEPLIAMDLEHMLRDEGVTSISVFSTNCDATRWLSNNCPTAAVIDITLKDGRCTDVAHKLSDRGVPFIIYSATMQQDAEDIFQTGIWLPKPCLPIDMAGALRKALQNEDGPDPGV